MNFEAWKLCKCNECCRGDGLPGYDCIIDELEQAYRAGLEDAQQRCRYMVKHQEWSYTPRSEYEKGFNIASELCEKSIGELELAHNPPKGNDDGKV